MLQFSIASLFSQKKEGFFNYLWNDDSGELLSEIPKDRIGYKFLYVNSLAAGVGSNDIGLDRGQLGGERVVSFYKTGKKILLIEDNLKYRSISDNQEEVKAVEEAFAKSVIFGFEIKKTEGDVYSVDMNDFLLRDAHGVIQNLKSNKQGSYSLDKTKSAIFKENLFNFPKNSEFEALLTFSGQPEGDWIKSVTPTASLVSVRQHHSFIELPDDNYLTRVFKPESGYFMNSFFDYAAPISEDMRRRFITRHRLEKKNPNNAKSEAIEPIVYYIDRGCPEPVKSALMEGARWWNEAFEAAGFINAFQVKELPADAHPLDVRYNMIQWVHRSTRGWSYGASVADPRTGEIIKGHVSLGSLRVRQDYMIAQGIISAFDENSDDPRMLEMALARLRQLSAHEVGHTIGLAHNFAASYNDRASVMDYPHPLVILEEGGEKDFSRAYDVRIGEWDKQTIIYGYSSPTDGMDEATYLNSLIAKNRKDGLKFITDQDARPAGGLHPHAHLWDNGENPTEELDRIIELRKEVLQNMGTNSISEGTPFSEIEKILVPAYLMHRYQVDATSKLIGGIDFDYGSKTDGREPMNKIIPMNEQGKALRAMLRTLEIDFLKLEENLLAQIPPPAFGYSRTRETFKGKTGNMFDPITAAEASANHTLNFLLNPQRLARIHQQSLTDFDINRYCSLITTKLFKNEKGDRRYQHMLQRLLTLHYLKLAGDRNIDQAVAAAANYQLAVVRKQLSYSKSRKKEDSFSAHRSYLLDLISKFDRKPEVFKLPSLPSLPPGSPIGCH